MKRWRQQRKQTKSKGREPYYVYSTSIDVVILDCIMNNTNGLKIYKQMLTKRPDLPVIFISGYTKNDVEKQFGEEIQDIFLLKPVQKEVLLTAINNIISYDYKK
jgi:two-component system, cell cycle sensor histidine kinase and response regulator CckA